MGSSSINMLDTVALIMLRSVMNLDSSRNSSTMVSDEDTTMMGVETLGSIQKAATKSTTKWWWNNSSSSTIPRHDDEKQQEKNQTDNVDVGHDSSTDDNDDEDIENVHDDFHNQMKKDKETRDILILTQHHMAWLEQFVLRASRKAFVVENCTYAIHECIGPLPALYSLDPQTNCPCYVGRHHPVVVPSLLRNDMTKSNSNNNSSRDDNNSHNNNGDNLSDGKEIDSSTRKSTASTTTSSTNSALTGNDILVFLRKVHGIDLDYFEKKLSPSQMSTSIALCSLINETLNPLLDALTYGDVELYNQIYHSQFLRTCCTKKKNNNTSSQQLSDEHNSKDGSPSWLSWPPLFAMVQTYAHKLSTIHSLKQRRSRYGPLLDSHMIGKGTQVNLQAILEFMNDVYQKLSDQFTSSDDGEDSSYFIFNTTTPTNVDAYLFDHLARALGNPHLLALLSHHSKLTTFFTKAFNQYFASDYDFDSFFLSQKQVNEIRRNNHHVNSMNPTAQAIYGTNVDTLIKAFQLNTTLGEILDDGPTSPYQLRMAGKTLHKWRMNVHYMNDDMISNPLEDEHYIQTHPWLKHQLETLFGRGRGRRCGDQTTQVNETKTDQEKENNPNHNESPYGDKSHSELVEEMKRKHQISDQLWLKTVSVGLGVLFVLSLRPVKTVR